MRYRGREKLWFNLRANMQDKITIVTPEDFLNEFVAEADVERPEETKDIFKSMETFSTARCMCEQIVSVATPLCPTRYNSDISYRSRRSMTLDSALISPSPLPHSREVRRRH